MSPDSLPFTRLKRLVSIEAVLAANGVLNTLSGRGDRLVGPCPLHGGDNPRAFVVSRSKNLWHCFTQCASGGDVIELVRRLEQTSYRDTARYLTALAGGVPTPNHSAARSAPHRPFRPFTPRLTLDPTAPLLQHKGITPATALRFDVGAYHRPGFLKDCIGVRLHDPDGAPLGYAGRRLNPTHIPHYGKWKLPPGLPKQQLLYNFHRARPALYQGWVVVECPWAVMRLAQLQIPAVALLGIHLSATQHQLLRHAPRLILLLDGDAAGLNATCRLHHTLQTTTQVHPLNLPPDHDPDDLDDSTLANLIRPLLL